MDAHFFVFFEPMALEVTTEAELYELLNYWKEFQCRIQVFCLSLALKFFHEKNSNEIQITRSPVVLPDLHSNGYLSFPP